MREQEYDDSQLAYAIAMAAFGHVPCGACMHCGSAQLLVFWLFCCRMLFLPQAYVACFVCRTAFEGVLQIGHCCLSHAVARPCSALAASGRLLMVVPIRSVSLADDDCAWQVSPTVSIEPYQVSGLHCILQADAGARCCNLTEAKPAGVLQPALAQAKRSTRQAQKCDAESGR